MGLYVQKFGGSSVATPERIRAVAQAVLRRHRRGDRLVVVVSAMGDATDDLIGLARQVTAKPDPREMDMLLATGEQVSIALMAMALKTLGADAMSFTGAQAGFVTDGRHMKARIVAVKAGRITQALAAGKVAIVAGFQG